MIDKNEQRAIATALTNEYSGKNYNHVETDKDYVIEKIVIICDNDSKFNFAVIYHQKYYKAISFTRSFVEFFDGRFIETIPLWITDKVNLIFYTTKT